MEVGVEDASADEGEAGVVAEGGGGMAGVGEETTGEVGREGEGREELVEERRVGVGRWWDGRIGR